MEGYTWFVLAFLIHTMPLWPVYLKSFSFFLHCLHMLGKQTCTRHTWQPFSVFRHLALFTFPFLFFLLYLQAWYVVFPFSFISRNVLLTSSVTHCSFTSMLVTSQCIGKIDFCCWLYSIVIRKDTEYVFRAGKMPQVVEHLPSKCEALISSPITSKWKKKKKRMNTKHVFNFFEFVKTCSVA
jgi:hypothetical protein